MCVHENVGFCGCALANYRAAEGDDYAVGGGVEDFDEGYGQGVEAGGEAEVAAEVAELGVAEVSQGQQNKGDPEEEEDAPDSFAGAEGDDPEQEGEEAPG